MTKYTKQEHDVFETVRYDSMMELLENKPSEQSSLDNFFDGEVKEAPTNDWNKHWKGMPEFENKENSYFHTVKVHFKCEEDYKAFAKLVEQNLTMKTKSMWYPKYERLVPSEFAWIDEEDISK
jgi:predicted metal-dependent HD superfamily phosphohydrolase